MSQVASSSQGFHTTKAHRKYEVTRSELKIANDFFCPLDNATKPGYERQGGVAHRDEVID